MFTRLASLAALGGLMLAGLAASPMPEPEAYIVVLRDSDADPAAMAIELTQAYGAAPSHVYAHALKGYAARLSPAQAAALRADPRVRFVSPDREVVVEAQDLPTGVDRIDAEPALTHTSAGAGVHVAVIDTGIDSNHRDLRGIVAGGEDCAPGSGFDDQHGHGTHVAGIIAAKDNRRGVVGVAPEASLWSVRVLDAFGRGMLSSLICGIDFVTSMAPANGGPIALANLSLGAFGADDGNCGDTNGDALHQAICRSVAAGVTYVVAAGNFAADAAGVVPAAYDEVITVSALADSDGQPGGLGAAPECRPEEQDDHFALFSNFGPDVDLAAPGVCILSTWMGGDYKTVSGTSMAAPHVTGAAALYLAAHPGAAPAEVRAALLAAAQLGALPGDPDGVSEGVVNAGGF